MSVFSSIKPVNHTPKNGFDLSRFISFSSKIGPIAQVFNQLTLADGTYELDLTQLCRTQPLQTAAFAGFTLNYDIQWMPLNHLYTSFNQFIAQREDKHIVNQPSYQTVPSSRLANWLQPVLSAAIWDYCIDSMPNKYSLDAHTTTFRRFIFTSEHSADSSIAMSVINNLDLMGYGNLLPIVKSCYKAIRESFFASYDDWNVDNFILWFTANCNPNQEPVFNLAYFTNWLLNFSSTYGGVDFNSCLRGYSGKYVSLWPVLAYNKCFYEYYRNTYYDLSFVLYDCREGDDDRIVIPYVTLFNADDFTPGLFDGGNDTSLRRLIAMFCQKPHLYKRDLFTAVLPDTQFGEVSAVLTDTDFHKLIGSVHSASSTRIDEGQLFAKGGVTTGDPNVRVPSGSTTTSSTAEQFRFDPALAISVLDLRRADSMQRFKERMLRAGERTKDIFKAHGWSEPLSEKSYEPIFLGSYDGRLDINPVASTTKSSEVDLGQLAANGVASVQGHKIKVHCKDFGILVVHFYIQKEAVYNSYGLDRQHCLLDPFDWPYPVLQNISFAPVVRGDLNMFVKAGESSNDIIGYEPRDMHFKTAIDRVCGEFFSDFPLDKNVNGVFSDWVTPRKDVENVTVLSFLYIHPSCADQIFATAAGVAPDTDQFLINCCFTCYAVEPLSVMNLPI